MLKKTLLLFCMLITLDKVFAIDFDIKAFKDDLSSTTDNSSSSDGTTSVAVQTQECKSFDEALTLGQFKSLMPNFDERASLAIVDGQVRLTIPYLVKNSDPECNYDIKSVFDKKNNDFLIDVDFIGGADKFDSCYGKDIKMMRDSKGNNKFYWKDDIVENFEAKTKVIILKDVNVSQTRALKVAFRQPDPDNCLKKVPLFSEFKKNVVVSTFEAKVNELVKICEAGNITKILESATNIKGQPGLDGMYNNLRAAAMKQIPTILAKSAARLEALVKEVGRARSTDYDKLQSLGDQISLVAKEVRPLIDAVTSRIDELMREYVDSAGEEEKRKKIAREIKELTKMLASFHKATGRSNSVAKLANGASGSAIPLFELQQLTSIYGEQPYKILSSTLAERQPDIYVASALDKITIGSKRLDANKGQKAIEDTIALAEDLYNTKNGDTSALERHEEKMLAEVKRVKMLREGQTKRLVDMHGDLADACSPGWFGGQKNPSRCKSLQSDIRETDKAFNMTIASRINIYKDRLLPWWGQLGQANESYVRSNSGFADSGIAGLLGSDYGLFEDGEEPLSPYKSKIDFFDKNLFGNPATQNAARPGSMGVPGMYYPAG